MSEPPVSKYRLFVEISGNSHDEIETELMYLKNGGYLLSSDYHKRDEFKVIGGHGVTRLEHTNPEQTPERYAAELTAWFDGRKTIEGEVA